MISSPVYNHSHHLCRDHILYCSIRDLTGLNLAIFAFSKPRLEVAAAGGSHDAIRCSTYVETPISPYQQYCRAALP